jgi:hypothetical protein
MGRYFARQEIGVVNYISIENSVKRNDPGGFSMDEVVHWVEEYTLIDLGGLDVNIESSPYDGRKLLKGMSGGRPINTAPTKATAEPDFLWFGMNRRAFSFTLSASNHSLRYLESEWLTVHQRHGGIMRKDISSGKESRPIMLFGGRQMQCWT